MTFITYFMIDVFCLFQIIQGSCVVVFLKIGLRHIMVCRC